MSIKCCMLHWFITLKTEASNTAVHAGELQYRGLTKYSTVHIAIDFHKLFRS